MSPARGKIPLDVTGVGAGDSLSEVPDGDLELSTSARSCSCNPDIAKVSRGSQEGASDVTDWLRLQEHDMGEKTSESDVVDAIDAQKSEQPVGCGAGASVGRGRRGLRLSYASLH